MPRKKAAVQKKKPVKRKKPVKQWTSNTIKEALLEQRIDPQEAINLLTKRVKPWQTKQWQETRDALIKDECVQCGSTAQPLVLQHLWHPRSLSSIIQEVRSKYKAPYLQAHPYQAVEPVPEPQPGERPTCPACNTTNIYWRQKVANWRCNSQKCGHIFDTPTKTLALTAEQKSTYSKMRYEQFRQAYQPWYESFRAETDPQVLTEATLISIEEHERYISCSDTVTFCKKCAFLWDRKGWRLCPVCRKHYMSFYYPSCYTCAKGKQIEKQQAA